MGYEAMFAGYEKWKKTDAGKEFEKKFKDKKAILIEKLPEGWNVEDGGVDEGYFVYWLHDEDSEIAIQQHWDLPCWAGGYPKLHFIVVSEVDLETRRERTLKKFSIHELGWDEAWKQANEFAVTHMESLI